MKRNLRDCEFVSLELREETKAGEVLLCFDVFPKVCLLETYP
jgi:hypothetical protein